MSEQNLNKEIKNHIKKESISKRLDLRNAIIMALVTALIGSIGFIINKEYFENKKTIEKNDFDKHKELYKEGSNVIEEVLKSYEPITSYLSTNYGSTPIELKEKKINALFKVKTKIDRYKKNLKKYSSIKFINTIENIEKILQRDYMDVELVKMSSKNIEDKITKIIFNPLSKDKPKITKETLKKIKKEIDKDLDEYIKFENALYFKFRHFSIPLIHSLENVFNSPYREKLGLDQLQNTDNLNKQLKEWAEYKYSIKDLHYQISRMRIYSSPTINMEGDGLKLIDEQIKIEVMIKYLVYVLNKKYPEKTLEINQNKKNVKQ